MTRKVSAGFDFVPQQPLNQWYGSYHIGVIEKDIQNVATDDAAGVVASFHGIDFFFFEQRTAYQIHLQARE